MYDGLPSPSLPLLSFDGLGSPSYGYQQINPINTRRQTVRAIKYRELKKMYDLSGSQKTVGHLQEALAKGDL